MKAEHTPYYYPSCIRLGVRQFKATLRKGRKRPVTFWTCDHEHQTQNEAMSCATRAYYFEINPQP